MPIPAGTRLGAYDVVALIGSGGMGEVYRARDAALNRDVAIKVLPPELAADPERIARFRREAQVLAALNHHNIAHVYGFEAAALADGSTAHFLAMELVEGDDLAGRLRSGAIPLDEAIGIATQIAEGLAEAHERGIVHRDLKPANVKVTPDGRVKILDFGLAKALASDPSGAMSSSRIAQSPTLSAHMTEAGLIIGTAAYMSPEQARGQTVDRRADIWAFGVVLYEMVSGQRLFAGDTVSDTLAAVLKTDPDWSRLPAVTPPAIRRLLLRCLEKDPKRRLAWIGGLDRELNDAPLPASAAPPTAQAAPRWRRVVPLAASAAAGAVLALSGAPAGWNRAAMPSAVTRLSIESASEPEALAISPDGTRVLLRRGRFLEIRSMASFDVVPVKLAALPSLDDAMFSPDGTAIAFTSGLTLKRTAIEGGAIVDLARLPAESSGCSWSGDQIYCAVGDKGIVRVAASGGAVEQVVTVAAGEYAGTPQLLPGGTGIAFAIAPGLLRADWQRSSIVVQPLPAGRREVVALLGSDPRYLPSGHLAYVVDGLWFAVPFDARLLHARGPAVPALQGVARASQGGMLEPRAKLDVSAAGTLVYVSGSVTRSKELQVVFADRAGHERALALDRREYESPRISPDGLQLALSTNGAEEADVWVYDLSEDHKIRRLTFTGRNRFPVWSPDGKRLAFQSDRAGTPSLYVQAADGSGDAERLTTPDTGTAHVPESWSSDGRYLSFSLLTPGGSELWLRSMSDGRLLRFGRVRANAPLNSAFSPDGKWIAYTQRGRPEGNAVFVEPVPATGALYQISTDGENAHHPFWSRNGKEFFYWGGDGATLISSSLTLGGSVTAGRPAKIAGHPSNMNALGPLNYDITPDGREFVRTQALAAASTGGPGSVRVVLGWLEELKRLAPAKP